MGQPSNVPIDNSMKSKLIKMNGWERDLFDTIDWENVGIVFRNMKETDKIQLFAYYMPKFTSIPPHLAGTYENPKNTA